MSKRDEKIVETAVGETNKGRGLPSVAFGGAAFKSGEIEENQTI